MRSTGLNNEYQSSLIFSQTLCKFFPQTSTFIIHKLTMLTAAIKSKILVSVILLVPSLFVYVDAECINGITHLSFSYSTFFIDLCNVHDFQLAVVMVDAPCTKCACVGETGWAMIVASVYVNSVLPMLIHQRCLSQLPHA